MQNNITIGEISLSPEMIGKQGGEHSIRVVCINNHRPTVYCGIAMGVGTRHELDFESGMAHCVEHMTFKGTSRRSAMQILNRMETVGGEVNAFTTKQETVYYSICLRQHLSRALDLLFDIVFNSTYPQEALDREVEVIIDEIESYNDSPSELIFDEFESLLFKGHPLGRSILGDAETLRNYKTKDLQQFVNRLYDPSRAVLFVMGDVKMEDIRLILNPSRDGVGKAGVLPANPLKNEQCSSPLPSREGGVGGESFVRNKSTHQAHVIVGCEAVSLGDERFMGLFLLNNILGGVGMNSRLNIALRERRGLVYTVESMLSGYSDTGVWNVYLGCDAQDVKKCLRIVDSELRLIIAKPLSQRAMQSAIRQLKGQLAISHDNFESVAIGSAKRFLHTGKVLTLDDMFAQLDALTPEYLHQLATQFLAPERMLTLIYK